MVPEKFSREANRGNWYDLGGSLAENQEYCRLMNIRSEADLQRIMMAGVPWQSLHVQQLADAICASLDVVLP
ncbi:hypothetical protein NUKP2_13580 [Klebsiella quasipneumoniae]|nr:hypothetical protein NUKP2_13580 [Klebsiella quasipneumoniae]